MLDDVKRRAGPFEGDGQVASFPFSFRIFSDDDVKVVTSVKGEAATSVLQKDVDYTVTVNADQDATPGGTVVLGSALAKGYVLSIISDLAYTQEVQLTNYSRFPPQILNDGLDRNVLLIQQLKEQVDRTIVVPPTSNETPEELLEEILDVAAKANEYVERAEEIRDEVEDRHVEIVGIRDHVDEQAAKVDAAMGNIEKVAEEAIDEIGAEAEEAIDEIGAEAEKKIGELGETTESLKSALGVKKNELAVELTSHVNTEKRNATQEIDTAKETAIANANERIASREGEAVASVDEARNAAISEVGSYATSAQQSSTSAIQAAGNAQQAASSAQSSAGSASQSAHGAGVSAASAESAKQSASASASQASASASNAATSASQAEKFAEAAEESATSASFSVRFGQTAFANSTVQATDLVPSVNVKVGDHVVNADGELFLIDSVKDGAVHVGEVIVTLKGKDGAGLTLNGELGSYNDLVGTRPVGQPGDAYLIQGDLWYWAEDDGAWRNAGPFRGPQGERGPQGFTFTPKIASDGTLSFTNNGGLENPATQNIRGPRGYRFTPSVDNDGNLSWSNDGDLDNPVTKNIRGPQGFTFTPVMDRDGNLSWSNNGSLTNPITKNLVGPQGASVKEVVTVNSFAQNIYEWEEWTEAGKAVTVYVTAESFENVRVDDIVVVSGYVMGTDVDEAYDPKGSSFIRVTSYEYSENGSYVTVNGVVVSGVVSGLRGKAGGTMRLVDAYGNWDRTYDEWLRLQGAEGSFMVSVSQENFDSSRISVSDVIVIKGTVTDRPNGVAFYMGDVHRTARYDDPAKPCEVYANRLGVFFSGVDGLQGERGYHFIPSVDANGDLSWSNDGGLVNPATVNIRGPQGVQGPQGPKGDGLSYDDLTPEQIAQIKGPKGDTPQVAFRLDDDGNLYYSVTYS